MRKLHLGTRPESTETPGAPGCAFLLEAFGFLPKSRTANRGDSSPFSNFYFLFSICVPGVPGDGPHPWPGAFKLRLSFFTCRQLVQSKTSALLLGSGSRPVRPMTDWNHE